MRWHPRDLLDRVASAAIVKRLFARYWYPYVSRRLRAEDVVVLNWGYEDDPPMGLPLAPADEPSRFCLQLYHRTATLADLTGKHVLEVSCGHGGGASWLVRSCNPASFTGVDLNEQAIAFCRQRHDLPGLRFETGDAEHLPFADESFDVVLNVEASHIYPRFPRFLEEVARVLRPGGRFLYADNRSGPDVDGWEAAIAAAPMRILTQASIDEQVLRGMELNTPSRVELIERCLPKPLQGMAREFAGVRGSRFHQELQRGTMSYRLYSFARD